jgi:DNA-binding FrmR family transcriptional regulator
MTETKDKQIIKRMNYLLGHLKGNIRMIEQNSYCIDVIRQNQAVIAALKKVNELILQNHLDTCVTTAVRGKDEKQRVKVLNELIQVFGEKENGK